MVLNGPEVQDGVRLVKNLPDSQGAIIKGYDSPYTSAIMADMNPSSLKMTIVKKEGDTCYLGIGIGGDSLGSLHPAQVLFWQKKPFLTTGILTGDQAFVPGQVCVMNVTNVKRIHHHKKIYYSCEMTFSELLPQSTPDFVGNLDVLVREEEMIPSPFEIGQLVCLNEEPRFGQILNITLDDTLAIVLWQDGSVSETELTDLTADLSQYNPVDMEHIKQAIIQERMNIMNLSQESVMGDVE